MSQTLNHSRANFGWPQRKSPWWMLTVSVLIVCFGDTLGRWLGPYGGVILVCVVCASIWWPMRALGSRVDQARARLPRACRVRDLQTQLRAELLRISVEVRGVVVVRRRNDVRLLVAERHRVAEREVLGAGRDRWAGDRGRGGRRRRQRERDQRRRCGYRAPNHVPIL